MTVTDLLCQSNFSVLVTLCSFFCLWRGRWNIRITNLFLNCFCKKADKNIAIISIRLQEVSSSLNQFYLCNGFTRVSLNTW